MQKQNRQKKARQKKLGLALGGGVALGMAHIGVLQAFKERGVRIDHISGTSAGAVIAALYAFGVPLDTIAREAHGINWFKITKPSFPKMGLLSNEAIGAILETFIGKANIEHANIPLSIIATDISAGVEVVLQRGSVIEAVKASACIPGVFTPISIDGRLLVDGVLMENVPLSPLHAAGLDVTVGVDLSQGRKFRNVKNVIDVIMNSIEIVALQPDAQRRNKADVLIEPKLGVYGMTDFKKCDELIAEGKRAADAVMDDVLRALMSA